jgi:hypothetical protein
VLSYRAFRGPPHDVTRSALGRSIYILALAPPLRRVLLGLPSASDLRRGETLFRDNLRNSNKEHRTLIRFRTNLNRALKRCPYDIMNDR